MGWAVAVLPDSSLLSRSCSIPPLQSGSRAQRCTATMCTYEQEMKRCRATRLRTQRFPWLYRHVHQQHHQHKILFALAAQDASSGELLSLLLLALLSSWAVGCHPLSEALFHLLNSWLAVEDHCGYDLPWALQRLLPGIGGAPHHQAHHIRQKSNYAPYFTHWDHLFGTYRE